MVVKVQNNNYECGKGWVILFKFAGDWSTIIVGIVLGAATLVSLLLALAACIGYVQVRRRLHGERQPLLRQQAQPQQQQNNDEAGNWLLLYLELCGFVHIANIHDFMCCVCVIPSIIIIIILCIITLCQQVPGNNNNECIYSIPILHTSSVKCTKCIHVVQSCYIVKLLKEWSLNWSVRISTLHKSSP